MNASSNVSNVEIAYKIASTAALFRKYFPDASVNFSPWDNLNNKFLGFKENNSSQITILGTSMSYLLLIKCYAKI